MINIVHSEYILPNTAGTVMDWAKENADPIRGASLQSNGCHTYHYVKSESLVELGLRAINKTLSEANVSPELVDALILFNTSACNTLPMPYTLVGELRKQAKLTNTWCLSISQQQCVSPIHALRILSALFEKHSKWKYALLVGVDTIISEDLRAIGDSGLHSDAASAILLGRSGATGSRITAIETFNDPRAVIGINKDGTFGENRNYLWSLISVIRRLAKSADIGLDSCSSILPHNVNRPAWNQALDALRLPRKLLFEQNFGRVGHAFGSDAAINIKDSNALSCKGRHLVFASGIDGCFGGFILETGALQ